MSHPLVPLFSNPVTGLELVSPTETKAVQDRLWHNLMTGMTEDAFWSTFVQCVSCGQVTFWQHYAVNHAARCSGTHLKKRRTMHPNIRHHPYRRNTPATEGSGIPIRMRLLARMETLIGDEPLHEPVRSLGLHRRVAETESAYNYDPEDVTLPDSDHEAAELSYDSGFETAQEDLGGSESEGESEDDFLGTYHTPSPDSCSAGAWWVPDVPELGSDDSLPDLLTILHEHPRQYLPTSSIRTQIEHAEGSSSESDSVLAI